MSTLTPRDLKDIMDLVSRKLEMYLNIDERERQFNPDGCYRVSPRMHKYHVMYRLLESTEYKKPKPKPSSTPGSKSNVKTPRITAAGNASNRSINKFRQSDSLKGGEEGKPQLLGNDKISNSTLPRRLSDAVKRRPIAIKTLRTPMSMVGLKTTKRLERYANKVYEAHPVKDLQKLHHICPNIPNNGKVHNYTNHIGAALNTKNYLDFYLKAGLDGKQTTPKRNDKQPDQNRNNAGSLSGSSNGPRSGDRDNTQDCPEAGSSRAVVKFISPDGTDLSEFNYKIFHSRDEINDDNNFSSSAENNNNLEEHQVFNDTILNRKDFQDTIGGEESMDRCKSRISRKSTTLNINFNSSSEDRSTSNTTSNADAPVKIGDTSTRTNSPTSTRESLDTPSSYQEINSSDSSDSSVLRYYRLSTQSTGSIHSSKNPARLRHTRTAKSEAIDPHHRPTFKYMDKNMHPCKSISTPKPDNDGISSSSCSSSSPRYKLTAQPAPMIFQRSSNRSNSRTDESIDSHRSPTPRLVPRQIPRVRRPRYHVKSSKEKQLIDLNITAILKSEMSVTGTGEADVFVDEKNVGIYTDDDVFERASDHVSSDTRQSRGQNCDDSSADQNRTSASVSVSREEYYKLEAIKGLSTNHKRMRSNRSFSPSSSAESPRPIMTIITPREEEAVMIPINTSYSMADTLPLRDTSLTSRETPLPNYPCSDGSSLNSSSHGTPGTAEDNQKNHQLPTTNVDASPRKKSTEIDVTEDQDVDQRETSSETECLYRGSDGHSKDGRGNSGRRSVSCRPSSRGCQWEDERPQSSTGGIRYRIGSSKSRDGRGDYQVMPEHRGIATEKGFEEGPEYYTITTYVSEEPMVQNSSSKSKCIGGMPPKSRPRSEVITSTKSTAEILNKDVTESRGDPGCDGKQTYLTQSEIYKALSDFKEINMDMNTAAASDSSTTNSENDNVQLYSFLPDGESSSSTECRGISNSIVKREPTEVSIVTKPPSHDVALENSMVFDLQEKTSEFRGKIDTEEANGQAEEKENVLGRGLSRASSMTSTLSWRDRYSFIKDPQALADDIAIKDSDSDENLETTTRHRSPFNVHSRAGTEVDVQTPVARLENMLSDLQLLVEAKGLHLETSHTYVEEETSSTRGDDSGDGAERPNVEETNDADKEVSQQESQPDDSSPKQFQPANTSHELNIAKDPVSNAVPDSAADNGVLCRDDAGSTSQSSARASDINKPPSQDNDRIIKLHQSLFLERALGISGDVANCMEACDPAVNIRSKRTRHLTSRDITMLNDPCLAVAKEDTDTIIDLKLKPSKNGRSSQPKVKLNRKIYERGDIEVKSKRPKSAVSTSKTSQKKRRARFGVYFSS